MRDKPLRSTVSRIAAQAGGDVAHQHFRADVSVNTKKNKVDYVTRADYLSQEKIAEEIQSRYQDEAFVSEEKDALKSVPDDGPAWVVDPIDGTFNFVRGLPMWAVSVACVIDGDSVAAANRLPALDTTFVAGTNGTTRDDEPVHTSENTDPETFAVGIIDWWDFDQGGGSTGLVNGLTQRYGDVRRSGASQFTLTMVAAGSLDIAVSTNPSPWNNIAGIHLIRQAGGVVTDLDGRPWHHDCDGFVASNGHAHESVIDAIQDHRK